VLVNGEHHPLTGRTCSSRVSNRSGLLQGDGNRGLGCRFRHGRVVDGTQLVGTSSRPSFGAYSNRRLGPIDGPAGADPLW